MASGAQRDNSLTDWAHLRSSRRSVSNIKNWTESFDAPLEFLIRRRTNHDASMTHGEEHNVLSFRYKSYWGVKFSFLGLGAAFGCFYCDKSCILKPFKILKEGCGLFSDQLPDVYNWESIGGVTSSCKSCSLSLPVNYKRKINTLTPPGGVL